MQEVLALSSSPNDGTDPVDVLGSDPLEVREGCKVAQSSDTRQLPVLWNQTMHLPDFWRMRSSAPGKFCFGHESISLFGSMKMWAEP